MISFHEFMSPIDLLLACGIAVLAALLTRRFRRLPNAPRRVRRPRLVVRTVLECIALFALAYAYAGVSRSGVAGFLAAASALPGIGELRRALHDAGPSLFVVLLLILLMLSAVPALAVTALMTRRAARLGLEGRYECVGRSERLIEACRVVVAVPVLEETLFRQVIPVAFVLLGFDVRLGLTISLVVFAVCHVKPILLGALNALNVGFWATVAFLATEQLWTAIVLHALVNLLVLCVVPEIEAMQDRQKVRAALARTA